MRVLKKILLPLLVLSIAFTGCGTSADSSSLTLNKKGGLTQIIVEEWDQELYDKKELETQIQEDIQSYDGAIELNSIRTSSSAVTVKMTYQDTDTYMAYNNVTLFQGSISQCQAAGYLLAGDFQDASGETVDRTDVLSAGDSCSVLVFQEPVTVTVPGKILYCSSSLEILSKKQVKASLEEGSEDFLLESPVYVIYK